MDKERRIGDTPIPVNLEEILSAAQRRSLPGIKLLGWKPRFVRKKMFQPPVIVMQNSNDGRLGMLDEDGRFKIREDIDVRESDREVVKQPSSNRYYY